MRLCTGMGQGRGYSAGRCSAGLLAAADFLWSAVVVAPLVVTYWRGSWDLLRDTVYPPSPASQTEGGERQLSGLLCYLVGLSVRVVLDLSKFHARESLAARSKWVRVAASWVFTAVYALAGVAFWRGVWFLMRLDIGVGWVQLVVVLVGSLAVLLATGVPRSLISTPLALSLDRLDTTFHNGTFFRKTPAAGWWFLIDVIFTNLVIRQLVVFCWWSLWSLENQVLTPKHLGEAGPYLAVDSLLAGYAGALLSVLLDRLTSRITANSPKLWLGRILTTLTTLLAFWSSVNVWRGVWSMLDRYFLPGINMEENYVVGHLLGLTLLSLSLAANTISNDNIVLDSEGGGVVGQAYWSQLLAWGGNGGQDTEEMVPIIE